MKRLRLFLTGKTEDSVEGLETWVVKWEIAQPDGSCLWRTTDRFQAFTREEDARAFKKSLECSFKTIRSKCPDISVYKERE